MASCVALMFSKAIDPRNPLYLDDSCTGDTIDWEFGLGIPEKNTIKTETCMASVSMEGPDYKRNNRIENNVKSRKKFSENKLIDPDEIIDPATLNYESVSDQGDDDDVASEDSDCSSDSLQPYDLSDNDNDLKRKFSQLVDVVAALRKSDDPDGVSNRFICYFTFKSMCC